jgi:phosphohistidine swiveling domain-containing protein
VVKNLKVPVIVNIKPDITKILSDGQKIKINFKT